MEFENFLGSARKFIDDAGQLTKDVVEMLHNLKKMDQDLKDVRKYNIEDQTIENACILVLFNYIPLKCTTVSVSKAVSEIKTVESNLPKRFQPKAEEIRSHVKSLEEKTKEIDSIIKDIGTQMKEFKNKKFKITDEEKTELEMLILDLNGDFKIAENYQKKAEEALQSLGKDVKLYLIEAGVLAVATATVIGSTGAVAGVGGAAAYAAVTETAVSATVVQNATLVTGVASGALELARQLYSNYSLFGATVALTGLCMYLVLKGWFAEKLFCVQLCSIIRNYLDMMNESRRLFKSSSVLCGTQ